MTTAHEAVAALPVLTGGDRALIRAMCTRRFAYCLSAVELATDFVAVDPASGTVPLYLIQNSTMFAYDSTDSTTAHDGATCLVSSEGKRFKSGTIAPPYSVLDKDLIAQPASPTVGDRYIIPTAATGTDWAGKDGKIGIYTAAGWRFAISPVGRLMYVEDETANYHRNAAGTWTAGVGSLTLGAGAIASTVTAGAGAAFIRKVENQTTNTPPASPVAPVAYIIGSSPTGAWASNPGKLAICDVTGTFTIQTPGTGDRVFDKALGIYVRWTGTAWVSDAGIWIAQGSVFTVSSSFCTDNTAGSAYTYGSATTPGTGFEYKTDDITLNVQARRTGAKIRFMYQANIATVGSLQAWGILRDAETAAIDWGCLVNGQITIFSEVLALDANAHDYKMTFFFSSGASVPTNPTRRRFSYEVQP